MAERSNGGDGGEGIEALQRLQTVVTQRHNNEVWRSFLVAQATSANGTRRREMTTQRIFLLGQRER
jgi:hypothetical protein